MSYEIIYGKQFVKLSETEFLPIILTGSNNCYEATGGRRSRSWWNWTYMLDGKHYGSLEQMLAKCEENRNDYIKRNKERITEGDTDVYDDKHYGYWSSLSIGGSTRNTTYGMFKGIFITGCKKAMTVEELKAEGIDLVVRNGYVYHDDKGLKGKERKSLYPETSEELRRYIAELEEYYKGTNVGVSVDFLSGEHRILDMQKSKNKELIKDRVKVAKQVTEYFVFKFSKGWFLKGTRNGLRYAYEQRGGKRIYNEKTAQRFCEKLNKRHSQHFEVEKIILEKPIEIFV